MSSPYFMCANSEGSGETARMRRLARAFAGRLCDKCHNLMGWLNYQVFIWIYAHENNPDLPDIEERGWKLSDEQIEYDWINGSLIVPEQLVDIL